MKRVPDPRHRPTFDLPTLSIIGGRFLYAAATAVVGCLVFARVPTGPVGHARAAAAPTGARLSFAECQVSAAVDIFGHIRERRQVGRGYQMWVECGSPTHVGCTHILPTFSVGKCSNNGRHDLSSPHLPQRHSSDLCASNTFQLTSTPPPQAPSPLSPWGDAPADHMTRRRSMEMGYSGHSPSFWMEGRRQLRAWGGGGGDGIGGGMVPVDKGSLYGAR